MKSAERAARRAAWPKWKLSARVVLTNGWAENMDWGIPIPAASLQTMMARGPKLVAATLKHWKVKGRSQIAFMRIEVRKVHSD